MRSSFEDWLRDSYRPISGGAVPPVLMPPPPVETAPGTPGPIPFRHATTERINQITTDTITLTTATQLFDRTMDGSGMIYGAVMRAFGNATGNSALVNFAEDAPYSIFDTVRIHDANAALIDETGYGLHVCEIMLHDYAHRTVADSGITSIYNIVPGSGADAGTFAVQIRVPIALNRRELIGLLSNQDRGNTFGLFTNIAGSAALYGTAPTALPTVTLERHIESYTIPLPQAPIPGGPDQEQMPPLYGTVPLLTRTLSEAAPAPGQVNHFVRRLGNTIRAVAVVGRSGSGSTPRLTFSQNAPTAITLKVGDEIMFQEGGSQTAGVMAGIGPRLQYGWERFGQRVPNGIYIFGWNHDYWPGAGAELGNDWIYSQVLSTLQLLSTYPAGIGSTQNSLEFHVADMVMIAPSRG